MTTAEPGIDIDTNVIATIPDTPRNRALRAKCAPALKKYAGIGVRIADDAITAIGVEWLSKRARREVSEIEATMRQKSPERPRGARCAERRT